MSTPARPICVLIAALGGEGGGVLTDWIVSAVHAAGFPVQATSIPGVAQRTGATTYYVEVWPQPAAELGGRRPILALAPAPGEVDLVVATELLEAGRTILNGFVTPERTHLIASTHRVYTTAEKMGLGDGRLDADGLRTAAETRAKSHLLADMGSVAAQAGSIINAVMLGAIAGAGILPVAPEVFADAIRATAKAVDANLRGFQAGLDAARSKPLDAPAEAAPSVDALIDEGTRRLTAFQDAAYAGLYKERLAPFMGGDAAVLSAVARALAVRMAYDDIIRIAGQKARRTDATGGGKVVAVTHYFKPGLAEVCDILPPCLAKRLLARADRDPWLKERQWPMTVRTTTISGFLRLWALSKLKRFRRGTYRYAQEQFAIDAWLDDVRRAALIDAALGVAVADMARLIKGYGETHRRGMKNFTRVRDAVLIGALNGRIDPHDAAAAMGQAVAAAMADEDGDKLTATLNAQAAALGGAAQ